MLNPQKNEKKAISTLVPYNSSKISSISDRYPELDSFRQQLYSKGEVHHYQPYTQYKKTAHAYRAIFIGFGLLFILLFFVITGQTIGSFWLGYWGGSIFAKSLLGVLCTGLSLTALFLGLHIHPETEAVRHLLDRAQKSLSHIFDGHGMLQHTYHEIMDKMHEMKAATLSLLEAATRASHLESHQKERLCNQAILELRDQLNALIRSLS